MAKSPTSELFSTLKGYFNQLSEGERTPTEVASAFNDWARESAESVKAKIAEEVETTVSKMGFIKREEYDKLVARVTALEKKSPAKKSAAKPVKKIAKKAPAKKASK
jgi:BMFP domain-containing protein YqiC